MDGCHLVMQHCNARNFKGLFWWVHINHGLETITIYIYIQKRFRTRDFQYYISRQKIKEKENKKQNIKLNYYIRFSSLMQSFQTILGGGLNYEQVAICSVFIPNRHKAIKLNLWFSSTSVLQSTRTRNTELITL